MAYARRAYTLFEMVLVLALLVMLSAIVYTSFDPLYSDMRMSAAIDQVRARWASARARAMNEGQAYRFAILPNEGNYRIAPDGPEYWTDAGEPIQETESSEPPLVLDEALPPGIRFTHGDNPIPDQAPDGEDSFRPPGSVDPGAWTTLAIFLSDGSAREDLLLYLYGPHVHPVELKLRGLTGTVAVRKIDDEVERSGR